VIPAGIIASMVDLIIVSDIIIFLQLILYREIIVKNMLKGLFIEKEL
jgi:hypothetical protein